MIIINIIVNDRFIIIYIAKKSKISNLRSPYENYENKYNSN